MRSISTFCDQHLGDNISHLHFLRAQAKKDPNTIFYHYAKKAYLPQLSEIVEDLANIIIGDTAKRPDDSAMDAWHASGGFLETRRKLEWSRFKLEWFTHLAEKLSLDPVFTEPEDLLFDFPAIQKPVGNWHANFLVINSTPMSGQLSDYTDDYCMDELIKALLLVGCVVATKITKISHPCLSYTSNLNVSGIGGISLQVPNIIAVNTGPLWPTYNIWNQKSVKLRIVLHDYEPVSLSSTINTRTIEETLAVLKDKEII